MTYSNIVLDHFYAPRNAYRMVEPDAVGKAGDPERGGPFMLIYLKFQDGKISRASFQTYGCGPAIAAGSLLTERIYGITRTDAELWTEPKLNDALGGLPAEKRHCSALAILALKQALRGEKT